MSILPEKTEARRLFLEIPKKVQELQEIEKVLQTLTKVLEKNDLAHFDYVQALNYVAYLIKNYFPCTILFQFDFELIIDGYTKELLDNPNPSQQMLLTSSELLKDILKNLDEDIQGKDILCKSKVDAMVDCLGRNIIVLDLILKYIDDLNKIHAYLYQKRTLSDEMFGNLAAILHGPVYNSTNTLKQQAKTILGDRSNGKQGHEYLRNYFLTVLASSQTSSTEKDETRLLLDYIDDRVWLSDLRRQVKIWAIISASTAVSFLLLILFIVIYSFIYQQTWTTIVIPLLSALPTFATMLVYTRVNNTYEMAQNARKTSFNGDVTYGDSIINRSHP